MKALQTASKGKGKAANKQAAKRKGGRRWLVDGSAFYVNFKYEWFDLKYGWLNFKYGGFNLKYEWFNLKYESWSMSVLLTEWKLHEIIFHMRLLSESSCRFGCCEVGRPVSAPTGCSSAIISRLSAITLLWLNWLCFLTSGFTSA